MVRSKFCLQKYMQEINLKTMNFCVICFYLFLKSELINFAEIDAVLISNYANMLALPYVTSYPGFKGIVYATDPTMQFGRYVISDRQPVNCETPEKSLELLFFIYRLLMDELVEYSDKVPKSPADQKWKSSNVLRCFFSKTMKNKIALLEFNFQTVL